MENLEISPNPTSGIINISNSEDIYGLSIYNALGKEVIEKSNVNSQIDVNNLPKGIYLIKVYFKDTSTIIKKFIKL